MDYVITLDNTCCFIEYGGRWVFRMINPGLNVNLFEINTGNVFYKSVPLQTSPYISCRINATDPITITNNRGRVTPGVSLPQTGQWRLTFGAHPAGVEFVPHVTLCPAVGQIGCIAVWPHTLSTELFVTTSTAAGSPQTFSFYITIF